MLPRLLLSAIYATNPVSSPSEGLVFFNYYFAASNEILDLGINHQGLQKSLGERLVGNLTMEGSDLGYLNPLINSNIKGETTSHHVAPFACFICIKTNAML